MQGVKRKLIYVSLYEVIGMTFSALGLALFTALCASQVISTLFT